MTAQPLAGVRVLEMAGLGPAPFAAMMLADLGADVIRLDRAGRFDVVRGGDPLTDGKQVLQLDLKRPDDLAVAERLVGRADVLVEGFRPGTMERLGLGPERCLLLNAALVFVRIDGWGEHSRQGTRAGHDINFLAELGIAEMIGTADEPTPPLNLIADFGGAGMSAVVGTLAALWARDRGAGDGTVVRTSLLEGAAYLSAMWCGQLADRAIGPRGSNLLDGGSPLYRYYRTSDDRWLAVGSLEPVFAQRFLDAVGHPELADRLAERSSWPDVAETIATTVRSGSSSHWAEVFADVDACVTVGRSLDDAVGHHPFVLVGDHSRPVLPLSFGAERGRVLRAQESVTVEEAIRRWS